LTAVSVAAQLNARNPTDSKDIWSVSRPS